LFCLFFFFSFPCNAIQFETANTLLPFILNCTTLSVFILETSIQCSVKAPSLPTETEVKFDLYTQNCTNYLVETFGKLCTYIILCCYFRVNGFFVCFSRNISFYYCEDVGHGTLFCAEEGTNPESATVHRLRLSYYFVHLINE